jgi:DNA (cytosine-5)-methyltransferase 1
VCSGIEAATVAWHPLGWKPVAFSEIEPFPSAVLAHHYPEVPNVGDMTKYKEWNLGAVDILVGGTPCQSFSVAGLRRGLEDPRGNLALVYCGILDHYRPKWFIWENVPGVLSSGGGRDFGSFLGALAELGYGFAYRVLDAQFFGVAQRRRRVFVVGHLGDWRPAAEVLFESESLRRDTAPSRQARKATATSPAAGFDVSCTGTLTAGFGKLGAPEVDAYTAIPVTMAHGQGGAEIAADRAPTLTCVHEAPILFSSEITSALCAADGPKGVSDQYAHEGKLVATAAVAQPIAFSRNDDGRDVTINLAPTMRVAGRAGGVLAAAVEQPIPFDTTQITSPANYSKPQAGDPCHPLAAGAHAPAIAQPITFGMDGDVMGDVMETITTREGNITDTAHAVSHPPMAVRRLTPVECERLQGFPDGYTQIAWRRSPEANCPDGPRYKALGNSMATPVMRWIGERIKQQESKQ